MVQQIRNINNKPTKIRLISKTLPAVQCDEPVLQGKILGPTVSIALFLLLLLSTKNEHHKGD